jgi:hypothetical protein
MDKSFKRIEVVQDTCFDVDPKFVVVLVTEDAAGVEHQSGGHYVRPRNLGQCVDKLMRSICQPPEKYGSGGPWSELCHGAFWGETLPNKKGE